MKKFLFNNLYGNVTAIFFGLLVLSFTVYVNGPQFGILPGFAPIIIALTISGFWIIRLHAYMEAHRIISGTNIDHKKRFITRSIYCLLTGTIVHLATTDRTTHDFYLAGACALYLGSLFWLLFDFILNYDRGLYITYISKFYRTALTDKFFGKEPIALWVGSKVVLFLFSLWLYIKLNVS